MLAPAARYFADRPAHALTRQDWTYFRDKVRAEMKTARKAKPEATTLNMEMVYWRHAHRWAIEEGLLRENPLERIRPIPAKKHRQTEPSTADIEALRPLLDAEGWAYVMLGQRRGLRASEARKLEWRNVDLDGGRVRFVAAKSRKWTDVSIPSDVVEALREIRPDVPGRYVFQSPRRPGQPVNATTLWRKFREAADVAGLVAADGDRQVVFHDTRHGFTSQMARRLPLKTAMRLSRHESLNSASRYIHVNEDDLERAHEVLETPVRKPAVRSRNVGHERRDNSVSDG